MEHWDNVLPTQSGSDYVGEKQSGDWGSFHCNAIICMCFVFSSSLHFHSPKSTLFKVEQNAEVILPFIWMVRDTVMIIDDMDFKNDFGMQIGKEMDQSSF